MTLIGVIQFAIQFGSLWQLGVTRLQALLNQRIDDEFKTERIQRTVTDVAGKQAKDLLAVNVQPAIDKVQEKILSFDKFLQEQRRQNEATYASLAAEVALLKERNRLLELADRAVSEGESRRSALHRADALCHSSHCSEDIRPNGRPPPSRHS